MRVYHIVHHLSTATRLLRLNYQVLTVIRAAYGWYYYYNHWLTRFFSDGLSYGLPLSEILSLL